MWLYERDESWRQQHYSKWEEGGGMEYRFQEFIEVNAHKLHAITFTTIGWMFPRHLYTHETLDHFSGIRIHSTVHSLSRDIFNV